MRCSSSVSRRSSRLPASGRPDFGHAGRCETWSSETRWTPGRLRVASTHRSSREWSTLYGRWNALVGDQVPMLVSGRTAARALRGRETRETTCSALQVVSRLQLDELPPLISPERHACCASREPLPRALLRWPWERRSGAAHPPGSNGSHCPTRRAISNSRALHAPA